MRATHHAMPRARARRRFWSALLAVALATPLAGQQTAPSEFAAVPDRALGLSKTSVFETPAPQPFDSSHPQPFESERLPRAYPGAPPQVPHEVEQFLPLTREEHACLACHGESEGGEDSPPPLPDSHRIDLRNAPGVLRRELAGSRFVCTSCHVAQAQVEPLVANEFQR
jgi:cytochrome c-type protein NapB